MNRLQQIKKQVVDLALPRSGHVPEEYWSTVSAFPMSYSVGRSIINFCRDVAIKPNESRLLIVGAHGGRDFHWLTGFGYEVDVLDLGHHSWGESTYIGDACSAEAWKNINEKYDLIVMHDVLEHLPEDFAALRHVRTVLKNDGYLFLSVPYRHDPEETHVRSYSEATLGRLLALAGFRTMWKRNRPGLLEAFPRVVNCFNYGLAMIMPTPRVGGLFLHSLLKAELSINERTRGLYRVLGASPQKGVTLAAMPAPREDHVDINRRAFIS
jgi:SAM-dependent methyltransferase